jgi:4-amino-4-deoxy-L-arabinose transferase-like glycosyltransferase
VISMIGGLVAAVLVQRLATGWWGEAAGRRAALLYCVFPGSVVFSMVYSEGLLLPLAAGCLLALERRRWIVAGLCAGFATATEPDSVVLVLVCAVAALLELRRQGWSVSRTRRALLAPALSLTGVGAFAIFMWRWTGSPTATLTAQDYGWHEKTDPFALVHLATRLAHQLHLSHFDVPTINLNNPVGLIGAVILIGGIVLLLRRPGRIPLPALIWTLGIGFLACTSEYVPPNPRLLITAWPAIVAYARYIQGRKFTLLIAVMTLLLIELSALTFVGVTLRP